ncbi:hypothetical protein SAMN04487958_106194 [Vreelandella subterranea]|uniref:Oxidoreductase molybdopterin-binding domain-containing protein n=1 Tax=Vreelandella subterranea TaxID=416874 RepID=A0A1H9UAP2_9GAMM|nr:hypothetical protein [Halomonas subterranea]SES06535.1 hypothetical protein SAMN04487958_106194 [Halomonas subterranea]
MFAPVRQILMMMAFAAGVFAAPVPAAEVTSSALSPSTDASPVLTLHSGDVHRPISRAAIEQSPLYEVVLQHFEGPKGSFAGVWLDDFLEAQEIDVSATLRFIAHDDYTTFITPEDRAAKRYLLVTRLDGKSLTRNEFGPTMLVIPEDAEAVEAGTESMTPWIWSIKDIYLQQ